MKTRPPWSRRLAAQPASASRRPTCSIRSCPAGRSRHLMCAASPRARPSGPLRPAAPGAGASTVPAPTRRSPSRRARLRELALERAACVVEVGAQAPPAQLLDERQRARLRLGLLDRHEDVDLLGCRLDARRLERQQQTFDSGAEADSRRRLAADLLDQPVVAAAAADGALRA